MNLLGQADPTTDGTQERNPEFPIRIQAARDVSDELLDSLNEVGSYLDAFNGHGVGAQRRYIALYRQGNQAWLMATSFEEAAMVAVELEEDPRPVPEPPEPRFAEVESTFGPPRRVETEAYRQWRREVQEVERWNQHRRVGLYRVSEFQS